MEIGRQWLKGLGGTHMRGELEIGVEPEYARICGEFTIVSEVHPGGCEVNLRNAFM
jgi:hypothetical protein